MPKAVRLGIACNRHPSDHSFWREREQFEAHLGVKGAVQLGVLGRDVLPVLDRGHGLRLVRLRQLRSDIGSPSSGFFVAFDEATQRGQIAASALHRKLLQMPEANRRQNA
jgi:hypothetical protein